MWGDFSVSGAILGRVAEGALYALLHDVGKPLVRLCWRIINGLELPGQPIDSIAEMVAINARDSWELGQPGEVDLEDFKRFVRELLESIVEAPRGAITRCYDHERVIEPLLKRIGVRLESGIAEIVKNADMHSAAERRDVDLPGIPMSHYDTPLLNPFKLANYLGVNTHARVELKLARNYPQQVQVLLTSREDKCVIFPGSACYQNVKRRLRELSSNDLQRLLHEEAWHPVKPLRWRNWTIDHYRAYNFNEARRRISYLETIASLLSGLYQVVSGTIRGGLDLLGVVETLLGILRRSLLYVPSAVYRSQFKVAVPELSLYAHSKATAAVAQATLHPEGDGESYRILVVDLKGIQKYIQAHRTVSAAVRAFRGRSLVVELAQRAVARWILRKLGLTWASILTYEGGRISIVIPCIGEDSLEALAREVEGIVEDEFMGLLGATVAWTDCIRVPHSPQQLYDLDVEHEGTLAGQLYRLNRKLQERRFVIIDFTGEVLNPQYLKTDPLLDRQVHTSNWVNLDERDLNILRRIAGDDGAEAIIGEGGASLDTLRSLVSGAAAVNLALIIEFYTKSSEATLRIVREVSRALGLWVVARERLAFGVVQVGGQRVKVGVIPFPRLEAVYLLVSIDSPSVEADDLLRSSLTISKAMLRQLSAILQGKVNGVDRVVVTLINLPEAFTNLIHEAGGLARGINAGLSLDWMPLNTFYPAEEQDGSIIYKSLDEAVKSGILAAASMDGDNMGNMMFFMAAGTSRFTTASELLYNTFGFHAARLLSQAGPDNVYVAYSGGDDAVMFGDFHGIIRWVIELASLYTSLLPGATISAAIVTGDVKEPLFLLFSDAKDSLESAKSTPLITVKAPDFREPIKWDGGIVNVYGAFEEVVIPVTGACHRTIEINGVPYHGPGGLSSALRLSSSILRDTTRRSWARRMLQAVKPLIEYSMGSGMKPEAAAALIQYSYLNERSKDEMGERILSMILSNTLDNVVDLNYPGGSDIEYERVKLMLAIKLAANSINLAVHLARTATS